MKRCPFLHCVTCHPREIPTDKTASEKPSRPGQSRRSRDGVLKKRRRARLAEETITSIRVTHRRRGGRPRHKPQRVIGDRGYDRDPLRGQFAARGIELIAPHRWNRSKPRTEDGRALRGYH